MTFLSNVDEGDGGDDVVEVIARQHAEDLLLCLLPILLGIVVYHKGSQDMVLALLHKRY